MNPLRWVRWKVVAVLVVLGAGLWLVGLAGVVLSRLNAAGRTNKAARFRAEDLALGLLSGRLVLEDILVGAPPRESPAASGAPAAAPSAPAGDASKMLTAASATVDMSTLDLLSRRMVVDRVSVAVPRMQLVRNEDGTSNVGDLGEGPSQAEPSEKVPDEARKPRDWVGTVQRWYDRLQRVRKWVPAKKEKKGGAPWEADYTRQATYPFEKNPLVEIREVVADDVQIALVDGAKGESIATLEKGSLVVSNLSSSPTGQKEPTKFDLSGELGGSKVSFGGTVDLREGRSRLDFEAKLPDLPAPLVAAFVGESLPVELKSGKVGVFATIILDGEDFLDVAPKLEFHEVLIEPKDPAGKIAGFDATQFANAFNSASREIKDFTIDDLHITGSLLAPKFEWGSSVKTLVVDGAKAFARNQAQKGLDRGREELDKVLEKVDLPPAAQGLESTIRDATKGVDAGAVEKLVPGLFGPRKDASKK